MRYSTEPRDWIYVKEYGFLSFAKNIGKSLSFKYGQKRLGSAKISTTDAIKTASKRPIHGDLIGNKRADKITFRRKNLIKNYVIMMMKQKM